MIPGAATLTLDLRHADDGERRAAVAALRARRGARSRARRGVELEWEDTGHAGGRDGRAPDGASSARASRGCASGAGHDAAMMASITPAAMLFVRCRGGISHNPAESVEEADVAVAIDVLERFLHAV